MTKSVGPLRILFLTVALDLIGFGMVVPLMPLYAEAFGASGAAIAWLMASYSLMQFVFAPLWGRLSDRVGRRPVLLISIAGNAAALLALATAHGYGQMLISRIVAGACTANLSVASAYVADVTTPERRARGMGALGAAFGLGFVLGPFFAGELTAWGAAAPAYVACALSLVNFVWALGWLPESLSPAARRHEARSVRPRWWRERIGVVQLVPHLWPVFALILVQVAGFAMMEMDLVLFVERRYGFGAGASGRMLAFVGLVMVAVQGGALGPLARRFGEGALVKVGLGAMALALLALAVGPGGPFAGLLASLTVLACGQGLTSPSLSALVSRNVPASSQGAALGVAQSLSALGRTVGPAAAGPLFDRGGEAAPLFAAGALLAGACTLACATLAGAGLRRGAQERTA